MSNRIPEAFIADIISRADIVEVVGRRVTLKRAGSLFKGLCPFHDEKTPSFTVTPARGTYKCFGCGAYGTAIRFLMDYDNMPFPEAVEALADMLGMAMPARSNDEFAPVREPLFALLDAADQIYRQALRDHPPAIEYLKSRGIDGETAARFGIGYAPAGWDTVLTALGTTESKRADLLKAGLIRRNDQGRQYDYFRDRLIFPIRNGRGQTLGFGGRVFGDDEPKYLNSPETPVFEKGKTLYGLHEARQTKGRIAHVLVVEGYMDVVALAQHGVGPALATLGTATTREHVQQLTRLSDQIIFCFDGDKAGLKAAWRALETCLPFGGGTVSIAFMLLPTSEDPDTLIRTQGSSGFNKLQSEAKPLSAFMIDELRRRNDLASADGRSRIISEARPLLTKLPDGVYRELLIADLAKSVEMPAERLATLLEIPNTGPRAAPQSSATERPRSKAPEAPNTQTSGPRGGLLRRAITLVLNYPEIAANVVEPDGFSTLNVPGAALLRALISAGSGIEQPTTAHLLEKFRDHPDGRYLPRLADETLLDGADTAAQIVNDTLHKVIAAEKRRQRAAALQNLRNSDDNSTV